MTAPDFSHIPNPWVWIVGDPQEQLIFTVNWDSSTGDVMSAIAFRDIDCVYETLYLGGTPYPIDIGETLIRYRDFPPGNEFETIADVLMTPITVGQSVNVNTTAVPTLWAV